MPLIKSSEIKNIIFDLGGVLLNINPLLSLLELEKISGIDKEELKNRFISEKVFDNYDIGVYTDAKFRSEMCRIINRKVDDSEMDRVWNVLLLDFPQARVEMLQQINKNYRVFLLSNTNSIHFQSYTHEFFDKYGILFADLFEKMFLSYEIGIHKPDAGIYEHLIRETNIKPAESVFFDDLSANIQAAEQLGINSIQITQGKDVSEYFNKGILKEIE
jgi:glucose-1-phosphatase